MKRSGRSISKKGLPKGLKRVLRDGRRVWSLGDRFWYTLRDVRKDFPYSPAV